MNIVLSITSQMVIGNNGMFLETSAETDLTLLTAFLNIKCCKGGYIWGQKMTFYIEGMGWSNAGIRDFKLVFVCLVIISYLTGNVEGKVNAYYA